MSVKQINTLIFSADLSNDDLNAIIEAVKFKRSSLTAQIKNSIRTGDNVEFTSTKTGRTMRGFVTKVAIKYVTVNTGMGLWKVPANMLKVVDKEVA
jgi:hypothetical protein